MASDEMNPGWEQGIIALLSAPTITAAAPLAGVTERTLRTWLKIPAFLALYREAGRQAVETAVGRLQQATAEAVNTLQALLNAESEATRLGAARSILDFSQRAIELGDLAKRIEELESLFKEKR